MSGNDSALLVGTPQVIRAGLNARSFQIVLLPGQVVGLSRTRQSLRVRRGKAWVSWRGEDIIIEAGHSVELNGGHDRPVLSEIGRTPAVVELIVLESSRKNPSKRHEIGRR